MARSAQIQVPFPDSSMPGIRSQESGGRIINAYVEPLGRAAPSPIIYRRAPGTRIFGTTNNIPNTGNTLTGFRGGMQVGGNLYTAFQNRLVITTAAGGAAVDAGSLTGTSKGFFARNNRLPTTGSDHGPDIVFCDPDGNAFTYDPNHAGTPPAVLVRPTAMGAPNAVTSMDGFFVFTLSNGQVWASALNDTTIPALSFATAEAKPDGLTRALPWAGNLFLFGPATTEVWSNVGATPFPFQRSVVIPRGIAGPYCVAGYEDNFSRALVWVADDNTVVRLNGYTPEKISPPDLDGLIEDVMDKRFLEMSVYMSRGHAFILLSASKASASSPWSEWSWVFDLNNERWAERNSYLQQRSRITGGLYAFNRWLCGDTLSGNILEITDQSHTEAALIVGGLQQPFRWRLESGAVENFPVGGRVGRFDCEFVTGVGITVPTTRVQPVVSIGQNAVTHAIQITVNSTVQYKNGDSVRISGAGPGSDPTLSANGTWPITVISATVIELGGSKFSAGMSGGTVTHSTPLDPIETDPVVEISWSDDGGQNYYAPILRTLGQQAQTRELVSLIACTGRSGWTARRWRLDISDPVHVGFMAAYQNVSPMVSDIG